MDAFLYSSSALFAIGCVALALSIVFRLKFNVLNGFPKDLTANVFNKTFVVFSPFSEQRKVIRRFFSVLPLIAVFASIGLAVLTLVLIASGFLLIIIVSLIGLNLIMVEEAPEAYQHSNTCIKAFQHGTSLGVGDVRLFQLTKRVMQKLSNYYLYIAVFFVAFSVALSYVSASLLWFFTESIRLMFQASAAAGALGSQVILFLLALALVVVELFASKIKNRFFGYAAESDLH